MLIKTFLLRYSYGKNVAGFMEAEVCAEYPGYYNRGWKKPTSTCVLVLRKVSSTTLTLNTTSTI